jgi:hypothetical protein
MNLVKSFKPAKPHFSAMHLFPTPMIRASKPAKSSGYFLSVIILLILLTGCYLPAARDDLEVLGDDSFSNLIRYAYSEKVLPGRGTTGISRIDITKAALFTERIMLGKSALELTVLFYLEGGHCSPMVMVVDKKLLVCEVVRTWKLKNIGGPFDTKNWSDPAVKLVHQFVISEPTQVAEKMTLEILDATLYKQIKG